GAVTAAGRIRQVLGARRSRDEPLLIEEYVPGPELSIDGLLDRGGDLTVNAVFDKPQTPDGPTFEETLLVSPSRLAAPTLAEAVRTAGQAAPALGLPPAPAPPAPR